MPKSLSPEATLYLQILAVLLFAAAAGAVLAVLRRLAGRPAAGRGEAAPGIVGRVLPPAALLLAALPAKLAAVRTALPVGERFFRYFDAAFVFFVIFFLIRLLDGILGRRYERKGRPFPLPRVLRGIVLIVVYIAVALAILRVYLGFNIGPLLAGSAILTAVLGLALQGVLGNIFAGLSLHYTRSFGRGDWVRIGEIEGEVVDTNWRETRLKDRAANIVVIPNTVVASQTITNMSLPGRPTAATLPVKIDFEAPPASVLELLVAAAREAPGVQAEPAPSAYLLSYDEFGLTYLVKFWITDFARKPHILGEVGRLAWHKLRRLGIDIPLESKVRGVLRALRPAEAGVAEADQDREANYRDLLESAFLNVPDGERAGQPLLAESELRALAAASARLRFGAREVLFRQGEPGDVCYIVARGRVRGEIVREEGGRTYTTSFEVGRGGIVGEMSLFTGLARTATIVVDGEAELVEVRAESLAGLLARNPALAEAVAEVVAARNRANRETLEKIKDLAARDVAASAEKTSVLAHLKKLIRLFRS
jgi:small-conductance mechanosensitive channel/CRP-like cAMP-binding protein